jgi:hypothetical protein
LKDKESGISGSSGAASLCKAKLKDVICIVIRTEGGSQEDLFFAITSSSCDRCPLPPSICHLRARHLRECANGGPMTCALSSPANIEPMLGSKAGEPLHFFNVAFVSNFG